jgi:site-specific recombinase XerD
MTPLRQRLIDDLRIRNYARRTITTYVAAVARFAQHFQQSPEQLHSPHVRQYQLHLLRQHASWSRFNQTVAALRFLYAVTLQRADVVTMIPYGKKPKTIPAVLSRDEVTRLFQAVAKPRYRLLLQTAYAAGLRVSEVVALHVSDIDSQRNFPHPNPPVGEFCNGVHTLSFHCAAERPRISAPYARCVVNAASWASPQSG